jgi:hypothetical protein
MKSQNTNLLQEYLQTYLEQFFATKWQHILKPPQDAPINAFVGLLITFPIFLFFLSLFNRTLFYYK